MKASFSACSARRHTATRARHGVRVKGGLTFVEVLISIALVSLMSAGLYAITLGARRWGEHNRLAAEARGLAKERLEEMLAVGRTSLAQPSSTLANADTNLSSLGYQIVRTPVLAWHSANRSSTQAVNAAYCEAQVTVSYHSPLLGRQVSDAYSLLIAE
jgi:type II secretory pathway pseudopilin PulG